VLGKSDDYFYYFFSPHVAITMMTRPQPSFSATLAAICAQSAIEFCIFIEEPERISDKCVKRRKKRYEWISTKAAAERSSSGFSLWRIVEL